MVDLIHLIFQCSMSTSEITTSHECICHEIELVQVMQCTLSQGDN